MVSFTLHAGLHKTATTSLQEHVFPNAKHVHYTGKCRYVMAMRAGEGHQELLRFLKSERGDIERIPLHVCCHYLALLQDHLVAQLARSRATPDQLQPLLTFNRKLLKRIAHLSDHAHILYSCEGLLLSLGHLQPEACLDRRELFPLAYHRLLFPGDLKRVVIYLRSPVDYLFSRYIQIHTIRCTHGNASDLERLITVERYLELNAQLWRGKTPSQSVFHHIFQRTLVSQLRSLGLPLVVRSYDEHILGGTSISSELSSAFDLLVETPEHVDKAFREIRLNTTSEHKDYALNLLLNASGMPDRTSLQNYFSSIASNHPLVKEALATSVFNAG